MSLAGIRNGLVVSCQAPPGSPLRAPEHMVAMARAAALGGAVGIRAEGAADVAAIKRAVDLPLIGLRKVAVEGSDVYITPTLESAREVVEAGAHALALDATLRPRPNGVAAADFIRQVRDELAVPVLADVDTLEAGVRAAEAGADAVATSLAGYTDESRRARPQFDSTAEPDAGGSALPAEPDVDLVAALVAEAGCPVVAEGRYATPDHVTAAFAAGAFAVVIGAAITDPVVLTRRLAAATPR
jgi:N-acylglucosamine-6-phosphate 2-epimerase